MNLHDIRLRVRALLMPRRAERELEEELAFHLEMETRKQMKAGLTPAEAQARAQVRFGAASLVAEQCRDARGISAVDAVMRDLLYALRTLRRTPTAALTIVGTVALGLGLVAAVFTVFNALVLRADGVRDPDRLFSVERVANRGSSDRLRFTLPEYEALRRDAGVFSDAFARLVDITLRIDGRMMQGQLVTGNFFEMLGVNPAIGRTLTPASGSGCRSAPHVDASSVSCSPRACCSRSFRPHVHSPSRA